MLRAALLGGGNVEGKSLGTIALQQFVIPVCLQENTGKHFLSIRIEKNIPTKVQSSWLPVCKLLFLFNLCLSGSGSRFVTSCFL